MSDAREQARALAKDHMAKGTFVDWFDELYRQAGLTERSFDDCTDNEDPPVRRFRVIYTRG